MYKKLKNNWIKHFNFLMADILCVQISFFLAFFLRNGMSNVFLNKQYIRVSMLMLFIQISVVFFMDPYANILVRDAYKELKSIILSHVLLMCLLFASLFAFQISEEYSRIAIFLFIPINLAFTYIVHILMKKDLRKKSAQNEGASKYLIITKPEYLEECFHKLQDNNYCGVSIVGIGFVGNNSEFISKQIKGISVIGDCNRALDYAKNHVVDDVLFYMHGEDVQPWATRFANMGIVAHSNIYQGEDHTFKYDVNVINGVPVLTASLNVMTFRQALGKRILDIIGGFIGSIFTIVLTIIITPIIQIQSPGPVFFSQNRVGKNGRVFKIYKFRSMYLDAEERKKELMAQNKMDGLMFKMDNDPRIYPFGNLLRKTSLDEFPQFFNILKGDMSLVGTRPPTVDEYEKYEMHHKSRLAITPGLTGLWQVSGRSDITDFEEVVRLDNKYIRSWTPMEDIKILFKTISVVFKHEGSV